MRARRLLIRLCFLISILAPLSSFTSAQNAPSDQFVIIALPDTQNYTQNYPQIFLANTRWIAANAAAMKIAFVAGLGDIVNDAKVDGQWQSADQAIKTLDAAGVPYGMGIGNHDYDSGPMDNSNRQATAFNRWFGATRYAGYPWYGTSRFPSEGNENFYTVLNINGSEYLFLFLEFYPRDAALAWASTVLNANPDKKVIVVTHGYENSNNYRMGKCDVSGPATYNLANDNDGDMMWSKVVSQFPNILLVLSGHMTNAGWETDAGAQGTEVNQLMSGHWSSDPNGGNGYLRIYKITPSLNRIDVQTYSPYANLYKTDSANQFSMSMTGSPMNTIAGQAKIRGSIRSQNCSALSGATVRYTSTSTGKVVTGSSGSGGYYSMSVASPDTYNVTASAVGYQPTSVQVSVQDGFQVRARFVLQPLPPDFAVSSSPTSASIIQGQTWSSTVTVSPLYGFTGVVSLAVQGLPGTAVASFSPSTVAGSGQAALTIATTAQTPVGSYPLTITGTSGSLQHCSSLTLIVTAAAPDFTITLVPSSQQVSPGFSGSFSVAITPINGFSDAVAFSVNGLPGGSTANSSPATVAGSGTTTLTVKPATTTAAGTYPLAVSGTDTTTAVQHTVQAALVVAASPEFSLGITPASSTLPQASRTTFTLTVTSLNGFTGTVTPSISGLPSGTSASFNPASIRTSGTCLLTISSAGMANPGTYNLKVNAASGLLQHTQSVALSVTGFSLTVSPASASVTRASSVTYHASLTLMNGYSGTETFSAFGLPSGVTSTFSPVSLAASGTATLTIKASATSSPGTYTFYVRATNSSTGLYHTQHQTLIIQ